MGTQFRARRVALSDLADAMRDGVRVFRQIPGVSVAYAAVFTIWGLILLSAIGAFGLSPLALPLAGGFMLLGPVLVTGYFEFAIRRERGQHPRLRDAFGALRRAPADLWMLALLCAFLFLIWVTDAGVLYSFTLAGEHLPYSFDWQPKQGTEVLGFVFWGSLMGAVLAFMIYTVTAFSVPLIYERRSGVVQGVEASVRAVFGNFLVCLAWGLVLSGVILLSILLLPVLLVSLPVMAYASFALYRRVFPALPPPGEVPAAA